MELTTRSISESHMLRLFDEAESCSKTKEQMMIDPEVMLLLLVQYAVSKKTSGFGDRR